MTSFKRTQRKYVQKTYRVRNWREYETGLRARGSLTVWLGLTDGKLANWNSPRPTRRKPGCTAPGSLDTHLCYAAWRSSYSSRASIGV